MITRVYLVWYGLLSARYDSILSKEAHERGMRACHLALAPGSEPVRDGVG